MKKVQVALALLLLAGLACRVEDVSPEYFCEMRGGTWHKSTQYEDAWCEEAKPNPNTQTENEAGESSTEPASDPQEAQPTEKYLTPTPASAQECNATVYLQTQVEILPIKQEAYYWECDYKLTVKNVYPSEGIWVVRRTNTSVHSSATDSDSVYWYSELVFPAQLWSQEFRSTYFTDGGSSREGVDRVAGVLNRPECLYLLNSPEVEAISVPVEWACGP